MHNCCSLYSVYVNCTSSSCIHFPPLCSSFTLFHLRQQCPSLFSLGSTSLTFFFTWDRNVPILSQSVLKKAEQFFFFLELGTTCLSLLWCLPTATWKSLCTLTYHFQFTLNLLWYLPGGIVSFSIFNFSHQVFGHLPISILISTFNNI